MSSAAVRHAAIVEGRGIVRVNVQRSIVVLNGAVEVTLVLIGDAAEGEGDRVILKYAKPRLWKAEASFGSSLIA